MDIRSLLSPQSDAPTSSQQTSARSSAGPSSTPQLDGQARRPSSHPSPSASHVPNYAQPVAPSPLSHEIREGDHTQTLHEYCQPSQYSHYVAQSQAGTASHPAASQSRAYQSPFASQTTSAPSQYAERHQQKPSANMERTASNPRMDTLADIAAGQRSRQHASEPRTVHPPNARRPSLSRRGHTTQLPPTTKTPSAYNQQPRGYMDVQARNNSVAVERDNRPRQYVSRALTEEDLIMVQQLATHLKDSPMDYRSYTALIDLLQKGLEAHLRQDPTPQHYELIGDLRLVREAMDKHFPVGEDIWCRWLTDEMSMTFTLEEQIAVVELFGRAVKDEPSSLRLWRLYGDYIYNLWLAANGHPTDMQVRWTAEERMLSREVFHWENVVKTWELAVDRTKLNIYDGNRVWDRWMEILLTDLAIQPTREKIQDLQRRFEARVTQAHATMDRTFSMFSSFMSTYDNAGYERAMMEMTKKSYNAKTTYEHRDSYEMQILQAKNAGDVAEEWLAFQRYLSWEVTSAGVFSFPLISGLFERAVTRFQTDQNMWLDYVEFLTQKPQSDFSVLEITERATRHCPWSGDLWAHRILTMEDSQRDFREIEDVKHAATSTGLLSTEDKDELMKVYVAWCGCLRRRAFAPGATEEALDVAELGIKSAMDYIREISSKATGQNGKQEKPVFDKDYRLERIFIKFLTQRGDAAGARAEWRKLISVHKDNYDFWYRYYIWEMVVWSKFAMRVGNEPDTQLRDPSESTKVLLAALEHRMTIDRPEDLLQMYLNHCEQHEAVSDLRKALITVRQVSKDLVKRRADEAAVTASTILPTPTELGSEPLLEEAAMSKDKRKRDEVMAEPEPDAKRTRVEEPHDDVQPAAEETAPTRDRENATIIVDGLPRDVQEKRIRQFFRDCGTINGIKITPGEDTASAVIEFADVRDAMYAESKTSKPFDDHDITVRQTLGSTLFVANYPPEADQKFIRDLFEPFGEIKDIRFPSLQGNTRRRFCYVQFATGEQAANATSLHDHEIGEGLKLQAKISNPTIKQDRQGAQEEGREVIVRQLHWSAVEVEVKSVFAKYGKIEKVRIPKKMDGKSKGVAFIVFQTKDDAEKAVTALNGSKIRDRAILVEIAQPQAKRTMTVTAAGAREDSPTASHQSRASSAQPELTGQSLGSEQKTIDSKTHKARSCALLNVSDTVSAARLQKLIEPHGVIQKLSLRPDHGGAIVEFAEERSVGVASLALEGQELDGLKIRVGTVEELLKAQAIKKDAKGNVKPQLPAATGVKESNPKGGVAFGSGFMRRPRTIGGGGKSKKPGLGLPALRNTEPAKVAAGNDGEGAKKSNADFRALIMGNGPKKEAAETKTEAEPKVESGSTNGKHPTDGLAEGVNEAKSTGDNVDTDTEMKDIQEKKPEDQEQAQKEEEELEN